MIVQQVSVFLENKSGRLREVAQILGDAGINISAFTVADTSDFGVLRLIVDKPEEAFRILKENHFSVRTTDVLLVNSSNRPGALSHLLNILGDEGIFIEYLYAFTVNNDNAVFVVRPTNVEKCNSVIERYKEYLNGNNK